MKWSKNKKTNAWLSEIEAQLRYLGIDEVKRYVKTFPYEPDCNIVEYGNVLIYYADVRKLFEECGFKTKLNDQKLWESYKRNVGYVARQLASE